MVRVYKSVKVLYQMLFWRNYQVQCSVSRPPWLWRHMFHCNMVVKKIWFESRATDLQLNVNLGVLPMLKEYVMVSQGSQTLVHKLHDKQLEVITTFTACFLRAEHLHTTPKKLMEMDFIDKMLPSRDLNVGPVSEKFKAENPGHPIVQQFLDTVKTAYMSTAAYMQKKLPLDSRTLQSLSAQDPVVRGHSQTGILLKRLVGMICHPHLISHWK
ncbi:uncharacterized protein LOC121539361 [Coregonus clupeaformis]|uniref:uncharacterized protein LOC121539361 n=1 Tax=Coregonus clupeaformis TaxID=59861 RepID=UPI001BE1137C|nr:uncharacterized protein LOC121539361 [Coregonus clupeaformis]